MTDTATSPMRPAFQFLIFVLCVAAAIALGSILSVGAIRLIYGQQVLEQVFSLSTVSPQAVSALWLLQIGGMTIPLFVAAIFFSFVVAREPRTYLKWHRSFPWHLAFAAISLTLLSLPMMGELAIINQRMHLPKFFSGLEKWMIDRESQAERLTLFLLKMNTVWDLLKTIFLVAGITAVVEEFVFRGVLQTIFLKWTHNHHAAIWIAAILFSAFHMEFFGFLPRLTLGVFFGYFVYWSGSVWTSVWAHFLNNSFAVVLTYLYQHKNIQTNPDGVQAIDIKLLILSIISTTVMLFIYRQIAVATKLKMLKDGD